MEPAVAIYVYTKKTTKYTKRTMKKKEKKEGEEERGLGRVQKNKTHLDVERCLGADLLALDEEARFLLLAVPGQHDGLGLANAAHDPGEHRVDDPNRVPLVPDRLEPPETGLRVSHPEAAAERETKDQMVGRAIRRNSN